MPVTDMGDNIVRPEHATGSSAFYYDFDSFEEMAITTGGADAKNPTSGVQLNMVLKSGADAPHGSTRFYFSNEALQGVNISSDLAAALGDTTGKGNRTDLYRDTGFELGGPLLQNAVWVWGAMSWNRIDLVTLNGQPDNTTFTNYAFKADGKLNKSVRGNFTFYENSKDKAGRDAGPTRPPETTWLQTGPTGSYKGEGNFVVGNKLFATAKGTYIDSGFVLVPVGGFSPGHLLRRRRRGAQYLLRVRQLPSATLCRRRRQLVRRHPRAEVRRRLAQDACPDAADLAGSHMVASWNSYPNMFVKVARVTTRRTRTRSTINGYVTDTIALNRLTLTGGLRVNHQVSSLEAAAVPAVDGFANLLPAISTSPASGVFVWNSFTPRVGFTLALDEGRKTIVRGSYAMFASQLPAAQAAFASPIRYAYAYYNAVDRNGDGMAQLNEVLIDQGLQGYVGFNPKNPSAAVNRVFRSEGTADAGIPRRLRQGTDAASVGQRHVHLSPHEGSAMDAADRRHLGELLADGDPDRYRAIIGTYSVPLYTLSASAVPPGGGKTFAVRDGYHQRYMGVEVSATKRLSNHWMARFGFSTNDWREYFDDPSKAILDPTRAPVPSPAWPFAGPQVDGGTVARASTGSGKSGIYMVAPSYQFVANGLYEAIWGISVSANLVVRQGYARNRTSRAMSRPAIRSATRRVLLVPHVDDYRLPSVTSLDGRVEKKFIVRLRQDRAGFRRVQRLELPERCWVSSTTRA